MSVTYRHRASFAVLHFRRSSKEILCFLGLVAPSAPRDLSILKKDGVRLVLAWKTPHFPNGVIRKYLIHFKADSGAEKTKTLENGAQAESLTYVVELPDVPAEYKITVSWFKLSLVPLGEIVCKTSSHFSKKELVCE